MRKLLFGAAALSALFFVACSSKDKNTPNNAKQNIIGTWKMTGSGVKYYDANNSLILSEHDPLGFIGSKLTFTSTTIIDYTGLIDKIVGKSY